MTFEQQLKSGLLGRIEDKKYLKFVRSLDCCVCEYPQTSPHHLIGKKGYGGKGTKAPDYLTFPLYSYYHTGGEGIHQIGAKEWEKKYGSQWDFIVQTQMKWFDLNGKAEESNLILQSSTNGEEAALRHMQWLMEHKK